MNNLNSILIEGALVKDPESAVTANGLAICRFTLASNRRVKKEEAVEEETSYFDVSTAGRLAEICAEYLKKGRGVRVVGRLKQERWETAEGEKRSKVVIYAEHCEFRPEGRQVKNGLQNETKDV